MTLREDESFRWILRWKLRFIHFLKVHPQVYQNYLGGPFVKGPMAPGGGVKDLPPPLGHYWLFFRSSVIRSVLCWECPFLVWVHQTWCSWRPKPKNWASWEFYLVNLFQPLGSQKCQYEGVPPTLQSAPSTFWGAFGTVINILGPPWWEMKIDPHFVHITAFKSVSKHFLSFFNNKAEKVQYINRCLFSTSYHHKLVSSWYL